MPWRRAHDWWASVRIFGELASLQIGWAVYVLARKAAPSIFLLGAGANLVAVATWPAERTSGLPFGPCSRGTAESAARADVIATVLGLAVAMGALSIARAWRSLPVCASASGTVIRCRRAGGSALSIVALTGVRHGHAEVGGHHGGNTANIEPAAATQQLSPAIATAQCRAPPASPLTQNSPRSAAREWQPCRDHQGREGREEQLKRALATCDRAPAPAQTKQVVGVNAASRRRPRPLTPPQATAVAVAGTAYTHRQASRRPRSLGDDASGGPPRVVARSRRGVRIGDARSLRRAGQPRAAAGVPRRRNPVRLGQGDLAVHRDFRLRS